MYKNIIKTIKKNKVSAIIITILIIIVIILSRRIENFSQKKEGKQEEKTVQLGGASRDPQGDIVQIEREHKCNQAGCATRETKQKKHILI